MKSKESLSQHFFNTRYELLDRNHGAVFCLSNGMISEFHRMSDVGSLEITKTNDALAYNTAPFARFGIRLITKDGGRVSYAVDGDNMATLMVQYKELAKKYEMPPIVECEYRIPPMFQVTWPPGPSHE